jgi:hypothetical protein
MYVCIVGDGEWLLLGDVRLRFKCLIDRGGGKRLPPLLLLPDDVTYPYPVVQSDGAVVPFE